MPCNRSRTNVIPEGQSWVLSETMGMVKDNTNDGWLEKMCVGTCPCDRPCLRAPFEVRHRPNDTAGAGVGERWQVYAWGQVRCVVELAHAELSHLHCGLRSAALQRLASEGKDTFSLIWYGG